MKHYIPSLDGWRAVAIGLVIATHSYTMLMHGGSGLQHVAARAVTHAGYGVDIFFGISGFLICTLLLQEKDANGTISLRRFYMRRAFRILPPMLAYLGVLAVLSELRLIPAVHGMDFLAVLGFFRNYVYGGWFTGHFWSLAVEEHFYAVVPIAFLLLPWRKALLACGAVALLTIGVRWYEFGFGIHLHSLPQFRTENRFDGLAWGAVLALLLHRPRIRQWFEQRLNGVVVGMLLLATVGALALFISEPARRTITALVIPLFIAYTVLCPHTWLGRLLNTAALRWVGRLSYSLYIWQMLFLTPLARSLGPLQAFPLALIMPLLMALASYYFVEKPMIRIGHRLAATPVKMERRKTAAHQIAA